MTLKILNLYAGIGGNRKLWNGDIKVTAIEYNEEIAQIYQDNFPQDKVIITDAHKYLLEHYKEYDFIWSSPPCPTHSDIRRMGVDIGQVDAVYPDMKLYEEIIFLKYFFKGVYVIENVQGYYEPLIKPYISGRHYFWSNFIISNKIMAASEITTGNNKKRQQTLGFNLDNYKFIDKTKILRNCVNPYLGLHIFKEAFKEKQATL